MIYNISQKDIDSTIENFIESIEPLKIKSLPVKEKRKYILLTIIIKEFELNKIYSEKEVNEILKSIYEEYAFIRRYLIDYKFLKRKSDGSEYWVNPSQPT